MPEAEVSLRLAFWLLESRLADEPVRVALDGAQIKTSERIHFDLLRFLGDAGWKQATPSLKWQCDWVCGESRRIQIHSSPGEGDVVARLQGGGTLRVECKKGPLVRSKSSAEYPLMREALGQLVTISRVSADDVLAIAVPHTPKFDQLAERWRQAPLIVRFGIRILTVSSDGRVFGLGTIGSSQLAL